MAEKRTPQVPLTHNGTPCPTPEAVPSPQRSPACVFLFSYRCLLQQATGIYNQLQCNTEIFFWSILFLALQFLFVFLYNVFSFLSFTRGSFGSYPGVAQLVARLLWEQDAGSSSLPTRTTGKSV